VAIPLAVSSPEDIDRLSAGNSAEIEDVEIQLTIFTVGEYVSMLKTVMSCVKDFDPEPDVNSCSSA